MNVDASKRVENFFEGYPARTYSKDQIAIFSGESPEKIFYIVSGRISQYDISYRGDEIVVNVFKSPAFFPMLWAINQTPNAYFYKAEEDTVVRVAPPEDVIAFIKQNPDVMFDLLARIYKGIDGLLERTVRLMSGSAKSRVMYELLVECRRFGEKIDVNVYKLKIHETELGAHAGLARETVSREIKRLKEHGLIEMKNGEIIVKDIAMLEEQSRKIA